MLYKAKSLLTIDQLNDFGIEHDNGYVVGWLVGEAIVKVGTRFEEERILGWWTNVDISTLTPIAATEEPFEPSEEELMMLHDVVTQEPIVAVDEEDILGMDISTTPDRTVVSTMPYLVKEGSVTLGSGSKKSFITVEPTVIATSKEALEAFEKYQTVDTVPVGTKLMYVQPHVEILTFIQEKARLALEGDNVDEAIYGLEDILQLVDEKLKGIE